MHAGLLRAEATTGTYKADSNIPESGWQNYFQGKQHVIHTIVIHH